MSRTWLDMGWGWVTQETVRLFTLLEAGEDEDEDVDWEDIDFNELEFEAEDFVVEINPEDLDRLLDRP